MLQRPLIILYIILVFLALGLTYVIAPATPALWAATVAGSFFLLLLVVTLFSSAFMQFLALRAPDGQRARLSAYQRLSLLLREWLAMLRLYLSYQLFAGRGPEALQDDNADAPVVVLVHGYFCNRGFFSVMSRRLRRAGWQPVRVTMDYHYRDLSEAAARLRDELYRIRRRYPSRTLVVVGHSMGGVAAVAALCRYPIPAIGVVALAAPLHGTLFGQWRLLGAPGGWRQPGLAEIGVVERDGELPVERLHCVFSWHDCIVIPQSSARLQGVDETPLQRVGHLEMAFSRGTHDAIIKAMEQLIDKDLRQ
jgi:pimeloyl-ACP methyl ester carboxylesterase